MNLDELLSRSLDGLFTRSASKLPEKTDSTSFVEGSLPDFSGISDHDKGKIVSSEISKLLRDLRLRRKFSAYELSQRCGVSRSHIIKLEKSVSVPTVPVLVQLLEVGLDISFSCFMSAVCSRAAKTAEEYRSQC